MIKLSQQITNREEETYTREKQQRKRSQQIFINDFLSLFDYVHKIYRERIHLNHS